jgi:hypothetical protein
MIVLYRIKNNNSQNVSRADYLRIDLLFNFKQDFKDMRHFFLLMLGCYVSAGIVAQSIDGKPKLTNTQVGFHLNVDSPFRSVMPEMQTTGVWGFSLAHSPLMGSPFYMEFKALFGNYGSRTNRDTYYLKNNWWYPAESYYKSGYQKFLLGPKLMVSKDFRAIRGFATPQIGLIRMRSKTTVKYWDGSTNWNNNDTNDDGSTQVNKTAIKQTSFGYGGEIGAEFYIQRLFKKSETDNFRIQLSGSFLRGFKEFRYSNVDDMVGPEHFGDEGVDFGNYVMVSHPNAEEINYVKIEQSPLQLWGINVGLTINF